MYRAYFDKFPFDSDQIVCYEAQAALGDSLEKIWASAGYYKTKAEAVKSLWLAEESIWGEKVKAIQKELTVTEQAP